MIHEQFFVETPGFDCQEITEVPCFHLFFKIIVNLLGFELSGRLGEGKSSLP